MCGSLPMSTRLLDESSMTDVRFVTASGEDHGRSPVGLRDCNRCKQSSSSNISRVNSCYACRNLLFLFQEFSGETKLRRMGFDSLAKARSKSNEYGTVWMLVLPVLKECQARPISIDPARDTD